jgi:hypothetical protein
MYALQSLCTQKKAAEHAGKPQRAMYVRRKPESPIAKMLIGGAASLAFEFGGGHALQFLKIQKQTTGMPYGTIIRQV